MEEALRPFAAIGRWLFASGGDDETVVEFVIAPRQDVKVTRGHLKAAFLALNPHYEKIEREKRIPPGGRRPRRKNRG